MSVLEGFEVMGLAPAKGKSVLTVSRTNIKFNKATAAELNYPPFVKLLLNVKTNQVAIQPCGEKDPSAVKFSEEESKQTYAIVIKIPALLVEFRRLLSFEDDVLYTIKGTMYPDENVIIYDLNDANREEKKRRSRKKKEEPETQAPSEESSVQK